MWDQPFILAVTGEHLSSAARYLSRASTYRENMILILFAVVIAAIWTTLLLWDRLRKLHVAVAEPATSIFDELCEAHRLDGPEVANLIRAAEQCALALPALLFVQPQHLDRLAGEPSPVAREYRQLRERLFGNV